MVVFLGTLFANASLTQKVSAITGSTFPSITRCGSPRGTGTIAPVSGNNAYLFYSSYYAQQSRSSYSTGCVKDIQTILNNNFCNASTRLAVDGHYGPKTYTAVVRFQQYAQFYYLVNGAAVRVDGITGPQTWTLLSSGQWAITGRVSCA